MNLLILVLVWLYILYNLNGLLGVIPFLICIINILITTFFLGINPNSYLLRIVRLLSIIMIVIIICENIIKLFIILF